MDDEQSTEWTLQAGRIREQPAVLRLRTAAFDRDLGKPEYSTAVVVQIASNDPTADGLTTPEEGDELGRVEDSLGVLVDDHALLVSVITGLGLRQYTWYSASPDWARSCSRASTRRSHGMRLLATRSGMARRAPVARLTDRPRPHAPCVRKRSLGSPGGGGRSDRPATRASHTGAGRHGPVWQNSDSLAGFVRKSSGMSGTVRRVTHSQIPARRDRRAHLRGTARADSRSREDPPRF
jgi:hypothetical protein